ncbi:MAG: hypothetical protein M3P53_08295 [Actinomycetota bacterium]|nr:hypothetical protein [Actinomycetota bacterium]
MAQRAHDIEEPPGSTFGETSPRMAGRTARMTGMALPMNRWYAAASAGSSSAMEATVASTERWKRTRRPSACTATENGSISWYTRPTPARSSSAGMAVMLMRL